MPDRPNTLIYLAGPDVFLPDPVEIGRAKKALCARYGFEGLFPFDNDVPPGVSGRAGLIYRANRDMMRRAAIGIFDLTPFRGPSADVGTAFELGFMAALGKRVLGYSTEPRDLRERVDVARRDPATGLWVDEEGRAVEDFGLADNLMLDCALEDGGYPFVRGAPSALAGFERCLRMAAGDHTS